MWVMRYDDERNQYTDWFGNLDYNILIYQKSIPAFP